MSITYKNNALYIRSEKNPNVILNIHALNGMLVMSNRLFLPFGKEHISTLPLAPGTYIANIVDVEGTQCSKKFVIK